MTRYVSLILLFIFTLAVSALGAGEVDPSFNASVWGMNNGTVYVVKQQPDGKILIGGEFTDVNGHATSGIARLNVDGTVDASFTPPDFFNNFGIGNTIFAIAVQPDGKILVGGAIGGANDGAGPGIRRLNADGSIDSSFFVEQFTQGTEFTSVFDIGLQSDGKIIIAGGFGFQSDNDLRQLRRLMPNGAKDTSFAAPSLFGLVIEDIEILPGDKIIAAGGSSQNSTSYLNKFNADGTQDATFTPITSGNGHVEVVKMQPDGKFIIGGNYSLLNGFSQGRVSRINADGSIDLTFNQGNIGANNGVRDIALQADGKILIGGLFTDYNSSGWKKIARLNANGTLDASFQNNPIFTNLSVQDVEIQASGKIVVGGGFFPASVNSVQRLNADGTSDSSFVVRVNRNGNVRRILQQPDGKILISGTFPYVNGILRSSLARLNADGSLDTSFVPYFNGTASPPPAVQAIALQPDGKILVGMFNGSLMLQRLNTDGTQDFSFNASGTSGGVNDIAVLPNGQVLAVGIFSGGAHVLRFNSNGTLDGAFAVPQPNAQVYKVLAQPDGKILIGGDFSAMGAVPRSRIARLNAADGSLDTSFNASANLTVNDIELQGDGKIILAGAFSALNGNGNIQRIGRLNADGTLDSSFIQATNGSLLAVKLQSDGKILIGGTMSAVNGVPRNGIARLNSNGSLDSTFNAHANTTVWDINLQTDGKILTGGEFTKINGVSTVRIARLLNNAVPVENLFDYDGDDKADVSVFRPSTNRWYIFKSSDSTVSETTFGLAGDIIAPADFDGDNKTDLAIFRPSSGDWWSLSSINGAQIFAHWGANGDIPRPSDFDGDGRADYIVFRPSNSFWYRISSATGASSNVPFGLAGDKPVTGDFDGDGKSDPAIFRPSTGDWWYQSSINNAQLATRWGISTDIPAPADFDGDGKTDFAVYRPSTGVWYIINSSNGSFLIMQFGIAEDKPVPADYDGDGKADIAVFRPSTGIWYQMKTTAGFAAQQFGVSTDVPTENAFVP